MLQHHCITTAPATYSCFFFHPKFNVFIFAFCRYRHLKIDKISLLEGELVEGGELWLTLVMMTMGLRTSGCSNGGGGCWVVVGLAVVVVEVVDSGVGRIEAVILVVETISWCLVMILKDGRVSIRLGW